MKRILLQEIHGHLSKLFLFPIDIKNMPAARLERIVQGKCLDIILACV